MLSQVAMRMQKLFCAATIIVAPACFATVKVPAIGVQPVTVVSTMSAGIQTLTEQLETEFSDDAKASALVEFYRHRNFQPLWTTDAGLAPRGRKLMIMLMSAGELGIRQPQLQQLMADIQRNRVGMAATELELSWRVLSLGQLLTTGLPREAGQEAKAVDSSHFRNQMLLAEISAFDDPEQLLHSWEPRHPDYYGLKQALKQYRQFAAEPWAEVHFSRKLIRPGYSGAEIPKLRDRLRAEGYLVNASTSEKYDQDLIDQVQEFQRRNGLPSEGIIGKATKAALNVSTESRLQQIQNSLSRLFALPSNLGEQYVWVNIPAYQMALLEEHEPVLEMKVIVGKPKHATPEIVDVMEFIELNPYWNVPTSITRDELIPNISANSGWLKNNDMEVLNWHNGRAYGESVDWKVAADERKIPFRLRQKPGRKNPLGQVKFLFPNKHAVYMHDTPTKRLFSRNSRAFSHGCVRLAEPMKLAEYVLANNFDGDINIPRSIRRGKNERFKLDRPIPVYLSYSTVWVDDENRLRFSKDIYRKDGEQPQLATDHFNTQQRQLRSLQVALRQPQKCKSCVAAVSR